MAVKVFRPASDGGITSWTKKAGAANHFEEVNQAVEEPTAPSGGPPPTKGVQSPAETLKNEQLGLGTLSLSPGETITGFVVRSYGKWTAKLGIEVQGFGEIGHAVTNKANESNAAQAVSGWAKAGWSVAEFPWSPWTKAELEAIKIGGPESLLVTLANKKASVQEVNDIYILVTTVGGGGPFAITATFAGAGALVAKPNAPFKVAAAFAGLGGLTDTPNTPRQLAATFPGTGSLLAAVRTPRQLAHAFAGVGSFVAKPNTPRKLVHAFTGVGGLVARVTAPLKLRAVFAGIGNVIATVTAFKTVTGQRTPTRFTLDESTARVAVTTPPGRITLNGAASRVAVGTAPSRIALDPQTSKVVI